MFPSHTEEFHTTQVKPSIDFNPSQELETATFALG